MFSTLIIAKNSSFSLYVKYYVYVYVYTYKLAQKNMNKLKFRNKQHTKYTDLHVYVIDSLHKMIVR